ncbi:MAG: hypothetical protein SH819_02185 [Cytophagales bacterium]|nr:hypothetical protein [Cytophagales bacterium]
MKTRNAIALTLLAEGLVVGLGTIEYGWTVEGLQASTRFSGRLSLAIFSMIFLLHPGKKEALHPILSENYFLVFAIAHGIHLAELLSYVILSGIPLVPIRVAGGFIAYAMIFLMPWFQYQHRQGKITPVRFQQLGFIYLFYVWFIFFMTYLARVNKSFPNAGGSYAEYIVLMAFVNMILGIKIIQILRRKA